MRRIQPALLRWVGLLIFVNLEMAVPAKAIVWEDVCDTTSSNPLDRYPTDEALIESARRAQEIFLGAEGDAAEIDRAYALLQIEGDQPTRPSAEATGEYCAAAGEAMRLSTLGSQYQAQKFLLTSFRSADEVGANATASLAAYRLGLVSLVAPGAAGLRGGRGRTRGGTEVMVDELEEAQLFYEDACVDLTRPRLQDFTNSFISAAALDCAAQQAWVVEDYELSARASLRLVRLGQSLVRSAGDEQETVRGLTLQKAWRAIPIAAQIDDAAVRGELIGRLIEAALELGGNDRQAIAAGLDAMRRGGASDAFATGLEARLALIDGDDAAARQLAQRALLLEHQRPLPTRLPQWYLLIADADPARRDENVRAAFTALENLRPLLPRFDPLTEEPIFSLYMRRVFERAVDVELASAEGEAAGDHIRRAQQIVEAYREAELQSVFGSECLPPRNPVRPEDLTANEVLLYPILLEDRVELLVVSGDDAAGSTGRYRRLPPNRTVDRASVSRLVEQVVLPMSFGQADGWQDQARWLYEILIAPIEAELASGSMLVVIPDGSLRSLPFAALIASDGEYLVEKTRLGVVPALSYSQPGQRIDSGSARILAASLEEEQSLPAGFFPRLEGTAGEVSIAADSLDHGRLIRNFTKAELVQAIAEEDVDVLHLATHASFNGRSDRSFIVADDGVVLLSELRAMLEDNRSRGAMLALLVLSACETAVGDDESSMGLAGAAVQAGALSALASLWQVNDAGTAELMARFYDEFGSGSARADALRDAQLALLESDGPNANPSIWAAFILLGAWR